MRSASTRQRKGARAARARVAARARAARLRAAAMASLGALFARPARRNNNCKRDGYGENQTIFGKILRGELPADVLFEDESVLVFRDINPVSDFHVLVIPKKLIAHCDAVDCDDVPLLQHMQRVALEVLQREMPGLDVQAAQASSTVALGYHKAPFITVKHLHLHCIHPMPVPWYFPIARTLAFPQHYGYFFVSSASAIEAAAARSSSTAKL